MARGLWRRRRTTSHSSVKLYHPLVPGVKYVLLVILARRRRVSRRVTSGPGTSFTSQPSMALCPRLDMCRAAVNSSSEEGRGVRIRDVAIDNGAERKLLAEEISCGTSER